MASSRVLFLAATRALVDRGCGTQAQKLVVNFADNFNQDAEMQLLKAQVANTAGDFQTAYTYLSELIKSHSQAFAIHHNFANCLVGMQQYDSAISHYKTAQLLNPSYAPSHKNLAQLLFEQGKVAECLHSYELLQQNKQFTAQTLDDYLTLLIKMKQHDKVLGLLESAGARVDGTTRNYHLAQAYRLSGDSTQATVAAKRAMQGMLTEDRLCQLAQHLISAGESTAAQHCIERVLSVNPAHQWGLALLPFFPTLPDGYKAAFQCRTNFIYEGTIRPPSGYASLAAYLAALQTYLFLCISRFRPLLSKPCITVRRLGVICLPGSIRLLSIFSNNLTGMARRHTSSFRGYLLRMPTSIKSANVGRNMRGR
ncbi:tetratricopeptide repeat protein [Salinimonas marina]|uniref:tetratricopeptide repeat protein n=1 Tax=Salinimonas marina TaxID=2785918 RepID=UPI001E5EBC1E|nr:tetratricopeptide repeat protein [Salinimonas marina]